MKKTVSLLFMIMGIMAMPALMVTAAVSVNSPAPEFTLTDTNGNQHTLSDYKGKYVVLEWVNYDCPFVKKHYQSGNMQKLQADYSQKDVVWFSVNSSAAGKQGQYSSEEVNEIMQNADAKPTAYLLDNDGDVGRQYGAQTTPHMFVIDPAGQVIYQGAIDNIPSFDTADIPKAQNYVQMALGEAMAGNPVSQPSTKSYGCSVKY